MSEIPDAPRIPVGIPSSESPPKILDVPHRPKIAEYRRCFDEADAVLQQYVVLANQRHDAVENRLWTDAEIANNDAEVARLRSVRDEHHARAVAIMLSPEYQAEVAEARREAPGEVRRDHVDEVLKIYERISATVSPGYTAGLLTLAVCTRSQK